MATLNLDHEVKQKKLTRFLCQELLYEYAQGLLTPTREKEMAEYINGCRDSQREFERLKRGALYVQKASQSRVSPAMREALMNFEPQWRKQLRSWTMWSSQRGWRMLPYIFVVLTLISGLIVIKPWEKPAEPDLILAEQLKAEPDMIPPPTVVPPADSPQPIPQPEAPAIVAPIVSVNTQPAPIIPPSTANVTPPAPTVVTTPPRAAPAPPVAAREDAADDKASAPAPSRGFIMRGELDVSDFANTWPMIRDKIIALGGKVAGNVELGWLRRKDQSYFHFTIPESNYPELELFLGTFGPVRFSRERHPRVMPEGQIRIILTVKDAMIDETPAETP